jgi:hypothetical protein
MAPRISWSNRGGWHLSDSVRIGPFRVGESVPIGRSKGRRRKTRRWITFRL